MYRSCPAKRDEMIPLLATRPSARVVFPEIKINEGSREKEIKVCLVANRFAAHTSLE